MTANELARILVKNDLTECNFDNLHYLLRLCPSLTLVQALEIFELANEWLTAILADSEVDLTRDYELYVG